MTASKTTDLPATRATITALQSVSLPVAYADAMRSLITALNTQSLLLCDVVEELRAIREAGPRKTVDAGGLPENINAKRLLALLERMHPPLGGGSGNTW